MLHTRDIFYCESDRVGTSTISLVGLTRYKFRIWIKLNYKHSLTWAEISSHLVNSMTYICALQIESSTKISCYPRLQYGESITLRVKLC